MIAVAIAIVVAVAIAVAVIRLLPPLRVLALLSRTLLPVKPLVVVVSDRVARRVVLTQNVCAENRHRRVVEERRDKETAHRQCRDEDQPKDHLEKDPDPAHKSTLLGHRIAVRVRFRRRIRCGFRVSADRRARRRQICRHELVELQNRFHHTAIRVPGVKILLQIVREDVLQHLVRHNFVDVHALDGKIILAAPVDHQQYAVAHVPVREHVARVGRYVLVPDRIHNADSDPGVPRRVQLFVRRDQGVLCRRGQYPALVRYVVHRLRIRRKYRENQKNRQKQRENGDSQAPLRCSLYHCISSFGEKGIDSYVNYPTSGERVEQTKTIKRRKRKPKKEPNWCAVSLGNL